MVSSIERSCVVRDILAGLTSVGQSRIPDYRPMDHNKRKRPEGHSGTLPDNASLGSFLDPSSPGSTLADMLNPEASWWLDANPLPVDFTMGLNDTHALNMPTELDSLFDLQTNDSTSAITANAPTGEFSWPGVPDQLQYVAFFNSRRVVS
jgi:hypothetical protein